MFQRDIHDVHTLTILDGTVRLKLTDRADAKQVTIDTRERSAQRREERRARGGSVSVNSLEVLSRRKVHLWPHAGRDVCTARLGPRGETGRSSRTVALHFNTHAVASVFADAEKPEPGLDCQQLYHRPKTDGFGAADGEDPASNRPPREGGAPPPLREPAARATGGRQSPRRPERRARQRAPMRLQRPRLRHRAQRDRLRPELPRRRQRARARTRARLAPATRHMPRRPRDDCGRPRRARKDDSGA